MTALTPSQRFDDEQPLKGARVMVVEDEFLILLSLETILLDAGAESVVLCRTMAEALAQARTNGLSAAILDVRIGNKLVTPVGDALEEQEIPFLFYTGQTRADPVLSDWPNKNVVFKPAPPHTVVRAVANLLYP